jgi:hypothetical protein
MRIRWPFRRRHADDALEADPFARFQAMNLESARAARDDFRRLAEKWSAQLARFEHLTGIDADSFEADPAAPESTIVIDPTEIGVRVSAR